MLSIQTASSFDQTRAIYEQGGHSKSYARLTLADIGGTDHFRRGDEFVGIDLNRNEIRTYVYESSSVFEGNLRLQYAVLDIQETHVGCQVGALSGSEYLNLDGCLAPQGIVTDETSNAFSYTYNPMLDNLSGRTIQGFSTSVEQKMLLCSGCPYKDAHIFYKYYGAPDYGDVWIQSALAGTKTNFPSGRGDADFSTYGYAGRSEAVKKATIVMNIFMYVIRCMEAALDKCRRGCVDCNEDAIHAWDEAVAFYVGSLERSDGSGNGKLLHQLADKRCVDFGTCRESDFGLSNVNESIISMFTQGQSDLNLGYCEDARNKKHRIVEKMYIPLIQSTLRYAFQVSEQEGGEKAKAEGAVFAASILPMLHSFDEDAAVVIYRNMAVGAESTSFDAVKQALESIYAAAHIKCSDVGGILQFDGAYVEGAEPCDDDDGQPSTPAPSALNTIDCTDSPLKMFVNWRKRGCNWVKQKSKKRCKRKNVPSHCPLTCDFHVGSCSSLRCLDTRKRFMMKKSFLKKKCGYISRKDEEKKKELCGKEGVMETCRGTCGYCDF